jgi:diguanylate cyclase (GGDEF)-like protein
MKLAAALIYWVIVAVWLTVLATVATFYFRKARGFGTTKLLLAVVAIDTVRNIVENIYFGMYFDAQYGLLPAWLVGALGTPALLIGPKLLNVASGCLVMSILLLRWLPEAIRERQFLELDADTQRKLATVDSMTGLYNRSYFLAAADVERQRFERYRRPLSMLMIDIDVFKAINDRYGHDVGDDVIVKIAVILRDETRGTDIVARLGGEEFGLLLPETTLGEAAQIAERLRVSIARIKFVRNGGLISPTISVGVSEAAHGRSIFDLMKEADLALYEAKQGGRDRVSLFDRSRRGHAEALT